VTSVAGPSAFDTLTTTTSECPGTASVLDRTSSGTQPNTFTANASAVIAGSARHG
jgi:hypothetical protein